MASSECWKKILLRSLLFIGQIRAANSKFKIWPFSTSQITLWPFHNELNCTKASLLWLSGRSELNLAGIRWPHSLLAQPSMNRQTGGGIRKWLCHAVLQHILHACNARSFDASIWRKTRSVFDQLSTVTYQKWK